MSSTASSPRRGRAAGQADCPEQVRHELETIAQQSERISRVVARMLDLARPGRAAETGSDLGSVAGEVLEFLGPELRQRGVRARMERLAEDASTVLDADRTFQVVFNLCLNAAEAQPAGGDILVRVLSKSAGARGEGSARVLLEVEDHGAGVPREALSHIFEPFFTTKSDAGGTGLGLAITSSIVREAGGSIEVVSEEGKGTCFRVALPRAPDRVLRSPRHADRGAS